MIRRVQNIYYMLAYAFQVLHENGYRDVAAEEFENGLELLGHSLPGRFNSDQARSGPSIPHEGRGAFFPKRKN